MFRSPAQRPTAAPTQSRSAKRWPITRMFLLVWTISVMALATMRVRTLLRFSTPLETPPKNSYPSRSFTAAWSPPRPRAISRAWRARASDSWRLPSLLPAPMDMVAEMRSPAVMPRIWSRMGKRLASTWRIYRSSMTAMYRSLSSFFRRPWFSSVKVSMICSISLMVLLRSFSLASKNSSEKLSITISITQGRESKYSLA